MAKRRVHTLNLGVLIGATLGGSFGPPLANWSPAIHESVLVSMGLALVIVMYKHKLSE